VYLQICENPGFFNTSQYERAYQFLEWMTNRIHTNGNYSSVGMLEVLNEPARNAQLDATLISEYYPTAWSRIRAAEASLGVSSDDRLHIQIMVSPRLLPFSSSLRLSPKRHGGQTHQIKQTKN